MLEVYHLGFQVILGLIHYRVTASGNDRRMNMHGTEIIEDYGLLWTIKILQLPSRKRRISEAPCAHALPRSRKVYIRRPARQFVARTCGLVGFELSPRDRQNWFPEQTKLTLLDHSNSIASCFSVSIGEAVSFRDPITLKTMCRIKIRDQHHVHPVVQSVVSGLRRTLTIVLRLRADTWPTLRTPVPTSGFPR